MVVTVLRIWMTQFSKCFLYFKTQKPLCQPLHICLPAIHLTCILQCFFNASHCYYVFEPFVSEDSIFINYCCCFHLTYCFQIPLRDPDSLIMAGIHVMSLWVSVACSELCQSHFCIWFIFCQDGSSIFNLCAKCFRGSLSKEDNLISPFSESKEQASLLTGNVLIWCGVGADIPLNLRKLILFLGFNSPS